MSYIFKPGDRVLVAFPAEKNGDQIRVNPARKLDGQEFIVKRKRQVAGYRDTRVCRHYYELYGAASEFGIPYGFLDDELIKL